MTIELDIGEDIELVQLLQSADPNDVSKLIEILTDSNEGRLALGANVKETLHAAQKSATQNNGRFLEGEIRLIVRELQLFAGNSLRNATRGSGVSYQETAKDVLHHIGGQCIPRASIEEIELSILEQLVTLRWQLDDPAELAAISLAAGVEWKQDTSFTVIQRALRGGGSAAAAIAGLPNLTASRTSLSSTKADALTTIGRLIKNPAALVAVTSPRLGGAALSAASILNQAAGEAYRITLPSVVLIAGIRQKNKFRHLPSQHADEDLHELVEVTSSPATEWILGTSAEHALVSASPLPLGSWLQENQRLVEDDKGNISRLAPILQAVPGLATATQQQGAEYVRVVVNGTLAKAADGDGLRGFVRDGNGKFIEHARFYEDKQLQNLVNSAALLQVASAVVAQKHLADISARLDSIDKEIKTISSFLDEARRAKVIGVMNYLKQIATPVLQGNQDHHVRQKLEDIETDISSVQEHLYMNIKNLRVDAETLKDPNTIGTSGLTRSLGDIQLKLENLVSQWALCHRTRLAACQLAAALDGEGSAFVKTRIAVLKNLEEDFFEPSGTVASVRALINARAAKMASKFESTSETFANQLRLQRWEQVNFTNQLAECRTSFKHSVPLINQAEAAPLVLAVKLEAEQSEIYVLSESPTSKS